MENISVDYYLSKFSSILHNMKDYLNISFNPYDTGSYITLDYYINHDLRNIISEIIAVKKDYLLTEDFISYIIMINHCSIDTYSRNNLLSELREFMEANPLDLMKMISHYGQFLIDRYAYYSGNIKSTCIAKMNNEIHRIYTRFSHYSFSLIYDKSINPDDKDILFDVLWNIFAYLIIKRIYDEEKVEYLINRFMNYFKNPRKYIEQLAINALYEPEKKTMPGFYEYIELEMQEYKL